MGKVLIFGASGFAGSYLCREFLNNGYKVYGTGRKEVTSLPPEASFYKANLMKPDEVEKLINKIQPDIIVNLAAISSVGASWSIPQTTMEVNVIGALNILEIVKKSMIKPKILLVGSSEEYAPSETPLAESAQLDASNPYGISKIAQEQFARVYREQYGLKIYCVRAFNHTGVGQKETFVLPSFCKQVAEIDKSGRPGKIKVGNIHVKRDFSHVKDVVRAYRMIIESDDCEQTYNVGSGKAYSLENLLTYIISLSSQNIEIEVDQSKIRPTDQSVIYCNHSLISKKIGWEPKYTVYDALQEMLDYYKNMLA